MRSAYFFVATLLFGSCVSAGKFKAMQQQANLNDSLYGQSMRTLKSCQDANADLVKQKADMQDKMKDMDLQLTATKENNTQMRKQLLDLSSIMTAQAESIKRSIDNISAKDTYIQDLRAAVMHRDSVNLAVLMEMKATMGGYNDADVHIHIDEGILYVDLSDSLLFGGDSTGFTVVTKAKQVLSRLARVLNDQSEVQFSIEGNTDSLSDAQDSLMNNWELSTKRAVAVVRVLQNDYHILPTRMMACGRGEYIPASGNDTPEGRAANKRTRVVIQPQLDRLLRVLEHKGSEAAPATAAPAVTAPALAPATSPVSAPVTSPVSTPAAPAQTAPTGTGF